jgi:hypothetical protein
MFFVEGYKRVRNSSAALCCYRKEGSIDSNRITENAFGFAQMPTDNA